MQNCNVCVDAEHPHSWNLVKVPSKSRFITYKTVYSLLEKLIIRNTFRSVPNVKRDVATLTPKLDYAFAFDIDGVLMLGKNPIPAAARALKRLVDRRVPFILLTNGGGKFETDRVNELSERLGVNVPRLGPPLLSGRSRLINLFRAILHINTSLINIRMS